jgi:large subunit ribosomal protein L29
MRFQESVGQLTNNARIRTIRKDLARILTIRHERVLDAELGN